MIQNTTVNLSDQTNPWVDKLNSIYFEIKNYQNCLSELITNCDDQEIISLAKKFKNDFSRKEREIEKYRHVLLNIAHSSAEEDFAESNLNKVSRNLDRFCKTFSGLKNCYDLFLMDADNH